jgi:bacterioferritin (cytochrome b1)
LLGAATSAVLGGGLLLSGCGGRSPKPPPAVAAPHQKISASAAVLDVDILNGLLDTEHVAIAAYTASIPRLHGDVQRAARQFLKIELNHADELGNLIARHGGTAVKPRASYDLGEPHTTDEILRLLESIERRQLGAYLGAIPLVKPGAMRASLASILGSEAQHIAIVRTALRKPALTGAFVTAEG